MGYRDGTVKAAETRDVINAFCSPAFASEGTEEESQEEWKSGIVTIVTWMGI